MKRTFGPGPLGWVVGALIANVVMGASAQAACQIKVLADLPLQPNPARALVQGAVDGKPVVFILDTGAAISAMPYADARKLGVKIDNTSRIATEGIGGSVYSSFGHFDMKLGQAALPHEVMTVLGMPSLDNDAVALVGRELVDRRDLEVDLPDNVVRIEQVVGCAASELAYWNKPYSQARLESDGSEFPALLVNVLLNGHVVPAEIDSGATQSFVTPGVAMTAGVDLDKGTSQGDIKGIGAHHVAARIVTFDTFTIGDETIKNARLIVSDMFKYNKLEETGTRLGSHAHDESEPKMLLGADFLRAHHVLFANSMRLMVFSYVGGPVFDISQPKQTSPGQSASSGGPASTK